MNSSILDRLATAAVLVAAVVVVTATVRRESAAARSATAASSGSTDPVVVEDWRNLLPHAITRGDTAASVVLIEFADFECPYCAMFHESFRSASAGNEEKFSHAFFDLPLSIHRFAKVAAASAECARRQLRFEEMKHTLFEKQDSLGLIGWWKLAHAAGVGDSAKFTTCLSSEDAAAAVQRRARVSDSLRIPGTPTVIINGVRYGAISGDSAFALVLQQVRTGGKQ